MLISTESPSKFVTAVAPTANAHGANSDATFPVNLTVPAASVGGGTAFQDVGGYVQLTPSNSRLNGNVKLSVPYYLVAHSRSNLAATLSGNTVSLTNAGGAIAGTPAFYTLGLYQSTAQNVTQNDVRAVGARLSGTNVIFGVNTHNRTSTPLAGQEIDVCIDTSGAPGFTPNFVLIGIVQSAFGGVTTTYSTALFPTDANCIINGNGALLFNVTQPTDNSNLQLPVTRASLGLTAANPRFKYQVYYYGIDGTSAQMPGTGSFNAFTPAITFSGGGAVAPNGSGSATVSVNATELGNTPALGEMLLAPDNVSGTSQALLLPVPATSP